MSKLKLYIIILSILLLISSAVIASLYLVYGRTMDHLNFANNDIATYKTILTDLECKINELSKNQKIKWTDFKNDELGIAFQYPDLWGKLEINNYNNNIAEIHFLNGVKINILDYSKKSVPASLTDNETDLSDEMPPYLTKNEIAKVSNIDIGGFKGYVSDRYSHIGGHFYKDYIVYTRNLRVNIIDTDYGPLENINDNPFLTASYTKYSNDPFFIENIIKDNPDNTAAQTMNERLEVLNKFISTIKFTK